MTRRQSNSQWSDGIAAHPTPKNSECKNPLEIFSSRLFGIKTDSSPLIIFQRTKLSTRSITNLCWCNWRTFWRKNAAGRSPKESCSCTAMSRLVNIVNHAIYKIFNESTHSNSNKILALPLALRSCLFDKVRDRSGQTRNRFVDCMCIATCWVRSADCYMVSSEWRVLSVGEEQEQKWWVLFVGVKLCNVFLVHFPFILIPCSNKVQRLHQAP